MQFPTARGPRGRARQRRRQVRDRTGGQARRGGEDQGRRRQRHGFDDGEALLARDGEYLRNALDEVRRALVAAGLEADVGASGSHHNPLLIVGDVYRGGVAIPDPAGELERFSVELWAFDWSVLDDVTFWID